MITGRARAKRGPLGGVRRAEKQLFDRAHRVTVAIPRPYQRLDVHRPYCNVRKSMKGPTRWRVRAESHGPDHMLQQWFSANIVVFRCECKRVIQNATIYTGNVDRLCAASH